MMKLKFFIALILIEASIIKLGYLWNLIHLDWLDNIVEEPWVSYLSPTGLMIIGVSLIYDVMKEKKELK